MYFLQKCLNSFVVKREEGVGGGVEKKDIVMSSSLFMLITYYSVLTDTNECD